MLAQLLGVWSVLTWEQIGKPVKIKIVELGPGKGTLMADLLRGTQSLNLYCPKAIDSVHLVEISQIMRRRQAIALQCDHGDSEIHDGMTLHSKTADTQITWHSAIDEIPKSCPELVLGHEFLDALPVHQFIRTKFGWRERMVAVAEESDRLHLRFIRAPTVTPAAAVLPAKRLSWMSPKQQAAVEDLEVGSDVLALGIRLAQRVSEIGGAALFIDYGKNGYYSWSVQGIRQHKRVDVLERPGETDVSACVDFDAFNHSVAAASCNAIAHGPIEQRYLLKALGIDARMEQLIESATEAQFNDLKSGYERLVGSEETGQSEGMGKLYKAIAITRKDIQCPIGFQNSPRAD